MQKVSDAGYLIRADKYDVERSLRNVIAHLKWNVDFLIPLDD